MLTIKSPTVRAQLTRAFAAAAILGVLSGPALAQGGMTVPGAPTEVGTHQAYSNEGQEDVNAAAPSPSSSMTNKKGHKGMDKMAGKKMPTPEEMAANVENRIKTLHDKLGITPDQESQWSDVAQAMRDNEASMSQLVSARHQNSKTMSAVDDLQSYQKIAQAHADGLGKVTNAFQSLYDDMPDAQKKTADDVFGRFEGHRGMEKASMTSSKKSAK